MSRWLPFSWKIRCIFTVIYTSFTQNLWNAFLLLTPFPTHRFISFVRDWWVIAQAMYSSCQFSATLPHLIFLCGMELWRKFGAKLGRVKTSIAYQETYANPTCRLSTNTNKGRTQEQQQNRDPWNLIRLKLTLTKKKLLIFVAFVPVFPSLLKIDSRQASDTETIRLKDMGVVNVASLSVGYCAIV